MNEVDKSPYFALVNREGNGVRLSNIERFTPYALPMIDVLMRAKQVYGQRYLFEPEDMLLFYIGESVSKKVITALKIEEEKIARGYGRI